MVNYVNKFIAVVVFLIVSSGGNAQEVIPAGGGNSEGSGGKLTFTVGQVLNNTNTGSGGTVSEGVQQPYEIWVYSGVEETNGIELGCSVFPNPVSDILTLQIRDFRNLNLRFQLYDVNGKILENNKIESEETLISAKNLTSGTYFLKVVLNETEVKIFKLIKH